MLLGKNYAGLGYKREFDKLLGDILQSQLVSTWDNLVLHNTLEVWSKYSSVTDSLRKMKSIDGVNHEVMPTVMRYVVGNEARYLDKDLVLEFYKTDEKIFVECCQSSAYSSFRMLILKIRDDSRLRDVQKIILESTFYLPRNNDVDFKIYKDAALTFSTLGGHSEEFRFDICKQCVMRIDEVISTVRKTIDNDSQVHLSLVSSVQRKLLIEAFDWFKSILREPDLMQDIWLLLLVRTVRNALRAKRDVYRFDSYTKLWIEWLKKLRDEFEEYRRYCV